jgi:GntR family transcriptional regulator, transcriptional repressor for pyruvate dehydrogenase complex
MPEQEPQFPNVVPVGRDRLSAIVKDQLTQMIVERSLKPGDKLPSEGELAARMGVSKPIVREALHAMAAMEVIEISHGRVATVRRPSAKPLETFLRLAICTNDVGLREAMEFRRKLEVEMAAMAAERATDEGLQQLEAAFAGMKEHLHPVGAIDPWVDADLTFHTTLARGARNSLMLYLVDAFQGLFRETIQMLNVLRGPQGVEATLLRHQRIVEAVRARDAQTARDAMTVHFDATERFLRANPPLSGRTSAIRWDEKAP